MVDGAVWISASVVAVIALVNGARRKKREVEEEDAQVLVIREAQERVRVSAERSAEAARATAEALKNRSDGAWTRIKGSGTIRLRERRDVVRARMTVLTGEKSVKQHFLSVAESYQDDLRAGVLRGELAIIEVETSKLRVELDALNEELR